jgi:hypothetical protein
VHGDRFHDLALALAWLIQGIGLELEVAQLAAAACAEWCFSVTFVGMPAPPFHKIPNKESL